MSSNIDTQSKGLGAKMNEILKKGTIDCSRKARSTHSVDRFYSEMTVGIQNTHAYRDHSLPVETILEVGVKILTENYRRPLKKLLEDSKNTMHHELGEMVEETLRMYPKCLDMGNINYDNQISTFQIIYLAIEHSLYYHYGMKVWTLSIFYH